jgi:hypothetical protein
MKTMTMPLGLILGLMTHPASGTLEALGPANSTVVDASRAVATDTREVTLPAGTVMSVKLQSSVGSDTSQPEQPVRGTLRRAVISHGVQVLPVGAVVLGHVTRAEHSGRVKGRASVAFRFSQVEVPGEGRVAIRTATVSRLAPATKKQDAAKIGGGAAGGAIIGGILGGGSGAAKGAAIGGTAGTGVVLATKGKEVHMPAGTPVSVRLTSPVTVRVAR